jgi:hypothetical protein
MMRRLGRIPSRRDPRTLPLRRYLPEPWRMPGVPPARDWTHAATAPLWGMFGNDVVGDCAQAACGHLMQCAAAVTGRLVRVRRADIEAAYAAITGWDPEQPATDRGSQMIDVLRYWRSTGIAGVQIDAFVAFDAADRALLEVVIDLFGGAYLGLDLPLSAQQQTVWDVVPTGAKDGPGRAGSWGGHAVAVIGYDRLSVVGVSWGAIRVMSREFVASYASEAYATLGGLWASPSDLAPCGFDRDQLDRDLAALSTSEAARDASLAARDVREPVRDPR